jgi:hypothetical protein
MFNIEKLNPKVKAISHLSQYPVGKSMKHVAKPNFSFR